MIQIRCISAKKLLSQVKTESIDLVFTSPPYNIGSNAPRRDGLRKKGKFDPKSYGGITGYFDSLPEEEYQQQQVELLTLAVKALKNDGTLVYNHKPRRKDMRMIHPMAWLSKVEGLTLMEEIIWDRGSTHNHSDRLMWPTTERLYAFRKTDGIYRFRNHSGLQYRSDVWRIPLTTRPAGGHAAPYPEPLAMAVLEAFSDEGDLVCDPYSGSGTTAVASAYLGRNFIGSEIDPKYHKASCQRLRDARKEATVKVVA